MKTNPSPVSPDLATLLRSANPARRSKLMLVTIGALVVLGLAFWLWARNRGGDAGAQPTFATEKVQRGDLTLTITATGNLEPTNKVTVGSELSGTVLEVYVDTNDTVKKGQPLAKLDTSKLAQQTESSRATVRSAQAKVAEAEATVKESEATLARQQELSRLSGGKVPSRSDLEAASASADRSRATLASSQAALAQAQAQVLVNESDMAKAIIKSPIDGLVLTRSVEPGQTVAASFTAPELFVIAESLEHMKLKVSIAEADIGRVAAGQSAQFTVDAWPDRTYAAKVVKVSYGSSVTNNVVSYETELEVANDDRTLRPGMTATADIRVAERRGVLVVPAAALRFEPQAALLAGPIMQKKSFVQSILPMPPRMAKRPASSEDGSVIPGKQGSRLWVLRDGVPQPVEVKAGLADGRRTEVSGEGLSEGLDVIVRANAAPVAP